MLRLAWTAYRALVILVALAILFLTPVFVSGPNGTAVDSSGALIDGLAIAALTVSVGSLISERRR